MRGNERAAPPRPLSKEAGICAWHYATRAPVRLRWQRGKITSLEAAKHEPPRSLWLAPPLVDLQINGFGGIDFQQGDLSVADLLTATRKLRAGGCLRFLLTLITNDWPKIMARLRHLRGLREQSPELQGAIAGWHIEGPFLSAESGYCGAHDPALMRDPTPKQVHELRDVTGDDPLLITIAPERRNAIAVISLAASLGIRVSLGHTNAPRETLVQAVEAGASSFTHLGNACPQALDRHDNILWRVFETPRLKVSLIPDAMHVSPALFRLIHRVIHADSIYYVSDAMAAAGSPPGRYKLGPLEVEVGEDKLVRYPGRSNFAGSALEPFDGVFRAAQMLPCDWQEAWSRFSDIPARLIGLPAGLEVGGNADFCLVEVNWKNQLAALKAFVGGEPAT